MENRSRGMPGLPILGRQRQAHLSVRCRAGAVTPSTLSYLSSCLAMTMRWIWLVPSWIWVIVDPAA